MDSIKILVFIPVWKRPHIFKLCMKGLARLNKNAKDIYLEPFCVVSEDWAEQYCLDKGIKYCWVENSPLGRKMNYGFGDAMKEDFDYLMQINSDTLLADELLEIYRPWFENKTHLFGIDKVHFVDSNAKASRRAKLVDYTLTICGAGKCLERKFLENYGYRVEVEWLNSYSGLWGSFSPGEKYILPVSKADVLVSQGAAKITGNPRWMLWPDGMNDTLDHSMNFRLILWGCENKCIEIGEKPLVLDLKSEVNIWTYDRLQGQEVDFEHAISLIPEMNECRAVRSQIHISN